MSQTAKFHQSPVFNKLSIKQKKSPVGPQQLLVGATTILEMDGVPLKGVTFFKMELKPGKLAKFTIEMVAELDEAEGLLGEWTIRPSKALPHAGTFDEHGRKLTKAEEEALLAE